MKKFVFVSLLTLVAMTMSAGEKKEVHILSGNDMHAAIECFPRLGFIADSLRALYPDLLVLSAGDNRSGDPLNDMFEIPAYPMVALMNMVGFHATTLGNHEFDSGQEGLARLIGMSDFAYICANIQPAAKTGIHVRPYQKFDVGGVSLGIVGAVALGTLGKPESHPDNMTDIEFTDPLETIQKYRFLRDECDVVVLLSHLGYEDDVKFSAELPWVDLIVGGHSHTQLKGGEMHNGLLITQNVNRLQRVTHTTLVVEDGKVVEKRAENIAVRGEKNVNKVVAQLIEYFNNNPAFGRVLATADAPFSTYDELGCLMADAFMSEAGTDIAFQNYGGVRYDVKAAGPITVKDVLTLDPFQNDVVVVSVTGKELAEMLSKCYDNDQQRFPILAGVTAEYSIDPANRNLKKVVLYGKDGKKLSLKKTYTVATNSYALAVSPTNRKDEGHSLGQTTASFIMRYLEKLGHVNYQGRTSVKEVR